MPSRSYPRRPDHSKKRIFRILPLGDSALTIEFGNEIDPGINSRVIAFAKAVINQPWQGIHDVVPTYRSVTIHFDPLQWTSRALITKLQTLPRPNRNQTEWQGVLHEIPVLYGGE